MKQIIFGVCYKVALAQETSTWKVRAVFFFSIAFFGLGLLCYMLLTAAYGLESEAKEIKKEKEV